MPKIAISYRRADTAAIAGRIYDHLTAHYGDSAVFMDIASVPFGTDFRSHVYEALMRADVLVAVIGANWLGVRPTGKTRIQEETDPVRAEIETALRQNKLIIPVLIDGAKMPESMDLPPELGKFAFLNAAEVSTGRDFRTHMDRIIGAIDQTLTPWLFHHSTATAPVDLPNLTPEREAATEASTAYSLKVLLCVDVPQYILTPTFILLVIHYVVDFNDLNNKFLWLNATIVPFISGFALFWLARRRVTVAAVFAVALGVIGSVGMTVSNNFISGDPIVPQATFEWRDDINFAGAIAASFLAGHLLARALRIGMRPKSSKTRRR
jgi:hypothetical protein